MGVYVGRFLIVDAALDEMKKIVDGTLPRSSSTASDEGNERRRKWRRKEDEDEEDGCVDVVLMLSMDEVGYDRRPPST